MYWCWEKTRPWLESLQDTLVSRVGWDSLHALAEVAPGFPTIGGRVMPNNQKERRQNHHEQVAEHTDLNTPKRMRYSYGLLMDKLHFDLEQQYFNNKRWLLNRRI